MCLYPSSCSQRKSPRPCLSCLALCCWPRKPSHRCAGPRLRETSIHICSESQGQTPSQLLPTGVQGLVPSPKAGTNCDSPPNSVWMSDPVSGDGSQTRTTGCGRNAGILPMGPTAARQSCSLLNQLHRTPIIPPRHLDAGQLCFRGHGLEERPLGRAGIPERPAGLGRRPVQASDLQASLALPRIRPQNAPPWKIMEMLIC